MFQFNTKTSFSDPNPTNVNPNTALPNSHGKVRTLKDDFEEMKSGKIKKEQELLSEDIAAVNPLPAAPAPIPAPAPRPMAEPPKLPERPAFLPPKEEKRGEKEASSPFGSQSFFNGKSPFEEETQPALPQKKVEAAPKRKSRKTLVIAFSSLITLAILGSGYYYWFFIEKAPVQNNVQPPAQPVQTKPVPPPNVQPSNKNLRYLNIDISLGKEVNQKAFQSLAENFLSNAAENDLAEVKILGKDNQPITSKDIETSLGFSLPDKLLLDLTNDFSLFIKRENSEVRTGAAFKLSDTVGLLDELGQQEKTLPSQLLPFYLKGVPAETMISFNSSKYKNADIRYFNFPEPSNTSLDYSILTDKQNGYFIFGTSKNTIRSILDFMWGK